MGVFGHQGWLKVAAYSNRSDRFENVPVVYLESENDFSGIIVTSWRLQNTNILLKLRGVDNPEKGRELIGKEIYLPENEQIELPADQYFLHDIIGMAVFDTEGNFMGHITEVIPAGANDVYVIRDGKKEVLIPAVGEFVKEIKLDQSKMVVRLWEEI